jgi:hypothetical protein
MGPPSYMQYVVDRNVVMRCMIVPEMWGTSSQDEIATELGLSFVVFRSQPIYVERNFEWLLCNHCCSGQAISITYSECVTVT